MRKVLLALWFLIVAASPALAQNQGGIPPIKIDAVRVGFKASDSGAGAKAGSWTPVFVDVTAGLNPIGPANASLLVECNDSDGMNNVYTVPLPSLQPKEQATLVTYARPGSASDELSVMIRSNVDGRILAKSQSGRISYNFRSPGSVLYVLAGTNSNAMPAALLPKGRFDEQGVWDPGPDTGRYFARVQTFPELPTKWFGWSAADLVVFHTGSENFVKDLDEDTFTNRKEALVEWLKRGGRMVISVGKNHQLANQLLQKLQIIGVTINGVVPRDRLVSVEKWVGAGQPFRGQPRKQEQGGGIAPVEIAKIEVQPTRGVEVLVSEADEKSSNPVIVQAPFGLGRVMLVGFDLETGPFANWQGSTAFFKKIQNEFEPKKFVENDNPNQGGRGFNQGWGGDYNDIASQMQQRLEAFEEVPVISFGWVALFILVYIIIVGPLDYFILKKVVKRLELTWITFPTVVLLISAIAYFTAYYLKGNDLRINKVDVVDIVTDFDPEAKGASGTQVQGTTWFTLFSPRIQNYTIGIEPTAPTWAPAVDWKKDTVNRPSVLVGWFGRPENVVGGTGRTGSPTLFRRSYDYAPESGGLVGVPIQVWATKSFTATWQSKLSREVPLFQADLKYTKKDKNDAQLEGTITNTLPADLEDAYLLFKNKAQPLGRLVAGQEKRINDLRLGKGEKDTKPLNNWFQEPFALSFRPGVPQQFPQNRPMVKGGYNQGTVDVGSLIKPMMFNDASGSSLRASTLRYLDESWRVADRQDRSWRDEVVLVARIAPIESSAEKVTQDPASASRLWLGKLPTSGESRPALVGKMSQETYVRVYLPVAPAQ